MTKDIDQPQQTLKKINQARDRVPGVKPPAEKTFCRMINLHLEVGDDGRDSKMIDQGTR